MIELMDLRAGNYIHPALDGATGQPDTGRYLRILSLSLIEKQVTAKADRNPTLYTLDHTAIYPCALEELMQVIGGLAFGTHSILINGPGLVSIVHEEGAIITLEHIQYLHQFQNLFRSLAGQEFPYNIK